MVSNRLFLSYIAGLIDGDGSLSIIKEKRSKGDLYSPCIQLSNVFKGMIELLHSEFGGSIKTKSRQKHSKKVQYVWNIRGYASCKKFLSKVIPFLVLKRERAQYLSKFIDECAPPITRAIGKDGRYIKREILDIGQSVFYLKMQSLNNDCLTADWLIEEKAKNTTEDPIFWSYFAGIMDTEGSFTIRKGRPSCGSINFRFNPMIQLTMATFETMNHIRKHLSLGSVCFPKANTTQRGTVYKLNISRVSDCRYVIDKLIPYLRFKKGVALELLRYCKDHKTVKHCRGGIPKEEIIFREECYQKILQLNK